MPRLKKTANAKATEEATNPLNANPETSQLPTTQLSAFERLPREIRDRIYTNLLVSIAVKNTPANCELLTYHFTTAILAANHNISNETRTVFFKHNVFIIISTNCSALFHSLDLESVPVVSKHRFEPFQQHHLRVHLEFSVEPDKLAAFLMVVEDLPRLARLLPMLNLKIPLGKAKDAKVRLQLRGSKLNPPAVADFPLQKRLLEPFKMVHGGMSWVKLTGDVDPAYREEVLQAMMPHIHQIRGEGWDVFRLTKEIKTGGDMAFHAGNLQRALERYEEAFIFFLDCSDAFPDITFQTDDGWQASTDALIFRNTLNITLAHLRLHMFEQSLPHTKTELQELSKRNWLKKPEVARLFHYRGLAQAELGKQKLAASNFRNALKYAPDDAAVRESLDILQHVEKGKKERRYVGISLAVAEDVPVEELEFEDGESWFRGLHLAMESVMEGIRQKQAESIWPWWRCM